MKSLIVAILLALFSTVVFGQGQPLRQALDEWVSVAEEHLVPLAEAVPAGKYSFAPKSGAFTGVRTFSEQIKHVAANNYAMAAHIEGRAPADSESAETGPDSVVGKEAVVGYLKGSFDALHKAVRGLDDRRVAMVMKGQKHNAEWFVIDAITHSFNHYGQLVEYLRMNEIIPPASR